MNHVIKFAGAMHPRAAIKLDFSRAAQHVLKAEVQRGAPDATDRARPFPLLPEQTPEQRAWLQRVSREALAKRFAP